jgi:hypothetical protein
MQAFDLVIDSYVAPSALANAVLAVSGRKATTRALGRMEQAWLETDTCR